LLFCGCRVVRVGTLTLEVDLWGFVSLLLLFLLLTLELEEAVLDCLDFACRGGEDVDSFVELSGSMYTIFMASMPRFMLDI
jgi:hypothetical protein